MPWQFKLVREQIKKLEFFNITDHPANSFNTIYPGLKTDEFSRVNPLLDSFILKQVDAADTWFTKNTYVVNQYAHLRLDGDDSEEFIHQDFPHDWAYVVYISDTNLESGTKMYKSLQDSIEDEITFTKFVENRIILFDVGVPHMAWGNHGKDLEDGRLTINGFCKYL